MTILLAHKLAERLCKNMDDYKNGLLEYDEESIISMAREIAATEDAFYHLLGSIDLDASEVEFLLKFQDPLTAVAELWEPHFGKHGMTFEAVLCGFFDDETLELYPLMYDPEEYDDLSGYGFDDAVVDLLDAVILASDILLNVVGERIGISLDGADERREAKNSTGGGRSTWRCLN